MNVIKWKNILEIHVPELDNQHKVWVGLLNKLYILHRDFESEHVEAMDLLQSLNCFLVYHFRFEEVLIRRYNLGDMNEHVSLHTSLIHSLASYSNLIQTNKEFVPADVVNNLVADHILHHDNKIADCLRQRR